MQFEFGDIVLVPFPFTSQAASKQRPAVIVSHQDYKLAKPDLVMMAITKLGTLNATDTTALRGAIGQIIG